MDNLLVNLDLKNNNNDFSILNIIKGSKNNLNRFFSKSNKDNNSFFSMITAELNNIADLNKYIFDFLKFLKQNEIINIDKGYKKLSVNKDFLFKILENSEFLYKLKSMLRNLEVFKIDSLEALKSELDLKKELFDKKEISKKIENVIGKFSGILDYLNTFMILTAENFGLSDILKFKNQDVNKEKPNKIKLEVKNFRKNNNINTSDYFGIGVGSKIIKNNPILKYKVKESIGNLFENFAREFLKDEISTSKNDFKNINLRSEWDLKINKNIVEKSKIVLKSNNTGEIRLLLKPKELGSIRINLNLDSSNNLFGKIIVDNQAVRTLFEQNMYSLNRMFNENGFNASISLGLAGENSGSFYNFDDSDNKKEKDEFISFFTKFEGSKIEEDVFFSSDFEKSINLII